MNIDELGFELFGSRYPITRKNISKVKRIKLKRWNKRPAFRIRLEVKWRERQ